MTTITRRIATAEDMRACGRALGEQLVAGDLVMLSGPLGAGKTTLTQGLGEGMGVAGTVASPTFIVARVHPSQSDGAGLVHVDAYRLTSSEDLETLDLDTALREHAVVVEWGEGLVESLSPTRVEIAIERASGVTITTSDGAVDLAGLDEGERTVTAHAVGERAEAIVAALAE
ncbi:tRNA (adenosine(37)-N6)-threonylcarbamoyltransferase complex ATPase subunit type 1 TsaE [Nanchangia anserum]|uniref:tRNA threonylcarbamoyladenosine biosynthesis protein TsaE n=1 Tax=Nanchangia anserum TaxID=2692125 RepID=A0A8I0GCX1_9ACTO|nr:tRNA (adenosine(37)-N6)-threonylcarbamoyltransferase complex ATPase subunit type 1 TsaE [Nanchangia anserum]MBD3689956.1 tRNA (adenosine(37)-N6)-threonylcarbamoyltransferase complex ATPase subunit type 1 TsaE [Nanchangia anserum]QOX82237.1 tRNA (adenosine(37)-N6)-threonylcarbamoyltransferase complex ATPase subunit type 1 TsaE [Nanchangia anserum]